MRMCCGRSGNDCQAACMRASFPVLPPSSICDESMTNVTPSRSETASCSATHINSPLRKAAAS
eukprot:4454667-Prymnesium_polylepis.1